MDLLFLLSAVSEVIAGIFYCKKEIVQNNRQIFKQFSAGMREQEKDSDRSLSSDGLLTKFSEFVCTSEQ